MALVLDLGDSGACAVGTGAKPDALDRFWLWLGNCGLFWCISWARSAGLLGPQLLSGPMRRSCYPVLQLDSAIVNRDRRCCGFDFLGYFTSTGCIEQR